MSAAAWQQIAGPLGREDSQWEIFHENSKATPHDPSLPEEVAQAYAGQMPESAIFEGFPEIPLPEVPALTQHSLHDAILRGSAATALEPCSVTLETAATLLRYAYGVAGEGATESSRRRRTVYSAGALFPLEIFVHCAHVAGLHSGLYHYYPPGNSLRFLRAGDQSQKLAPG